MTATWRSTTWRRSSAPSASRRSAATRPGLTLVGRETVGIPHEQLAAGHAGPDVAPDWTEHHDRTAGHVLAEMVAGPLHHCGGAGIAHGEALAGLTGDEQLSAGGTVEAGVAGQHRVAGVAGGRADRGHATAQDLADIVVGLSCQVEVNAVDPEGAEALPGRAGQADPGGASRGVVVNPRARAPPRAAPTVRSLLVIV